MSMTIEQLEKSLAAMIGGVIKYTLELNKQQPGETGQQLPEMSVLMTVALDIPNAGHRILLKCGWEYEDKSNVRREPDDDDLH